MEKVDDVKMVMAEAFALKVISLCRNLQSLKHEYNISNQIFRSATSIGANIAESQYAESKIDFSHKLAIAQKEASETYYWLRLLHKGDYIGDKLYNDLITDCRALITLLGRIICTCKSVSK
jgi:four helix bundle protein